MPSAVISVPIFSDDSMLSKRARSTLRILPRSGRIAWFWRERPRLAEPPAESPSTMKSSDLAGSRSGQSASLPGSEVMSSAALARVRSRALRAASRAAAASTTLPTTILASAGCSSSQVLERLVDEVFDHRAHFGGDQLVLGLRGEFRIRHLDRQHGRQALAAVVAGQRRPFPSW